MTWERSIQKKKIPRKCGEGKCSLHHASIYNCNRLQLSCVEFPRMAHGCQREERQCTQPQRLLKGREEIWLREDLITTVSAKADLEGPSQSLLAQT